MNPLLLQGLFSFLPGLLGGLFGGDPQKKLRKQVGKLISPGNVANTTNQFYQQAIGGPAFSQAQGAIAAGANQAGNQVQQNLAARGIGTSGTGAILSGLLPSLVGSQQAQLRTGAYQSAQQQAQNTIQQQIANLTGTQGPSPLRQGIAGGFETFAPFLQAFLQQLQGGQGLNRMIGDVQNYNPPLPGRR